MKIEEFLSQDDKEILQFVSSPSFVKWHAEYFYGKNSTNGLDNT